LDVLENDKDQSFAYQLNLPFNSKIKTDEWKNWSCYSCCHSR
jgi:hypothetical protein